MGRRASAATGIIDIGAYGADLHIRELVDIHRQADPAFKAMLNAVRYGRVTADIAQVLNDTGARTPPDPADGEHPIITLATRNDIVNSINRRHLDELVGREQTAIAEISGDFGRGDASYPADVDLKLKVGAQVMFLRNDTGSYGEPPRWVNGTIGTVTRIAGGTVRVEVEGERVRRRAGRLGEVPLRVRPRLEVADPRDRRRVHAVPAAARLGGDDPQVAGQDVRAGDHRPRLRRVRARARPTSRSSRLTSLDGLYLSRPLRPSDIRVDPDVQRFMAGVARPPRPDPL